MTHIPGVLIYFDIFVYFIIIIYLFILYIIIKRVDGLGVVPARVGFETVEIYKFIRRTFWMIKKHHVDSICNCYIMLTKSHDSHNGHLDC